MAKQKPRRVRRMMARIALTKEAYRQVEASAFRNCRTVSQELTFMVESMIQKPSRQISHAGRYDDPQPNIPVVQDEVAEEQSISPAEPPRSDWSQEDEDRVNQLAQVRGIHEGELNALKLLHKTPEAVMAALEAEKEAVA